MLRLLHTSDWHLGQSLRDMDRHEEHRLFLAWLGNLLEDNHRKGTPFHATLVAGDVFDGPNPSARAQGLYYDFIEKARHFTRLVITAGNHDSAERLQAPSPLLERLGTFVTGGWPEPGAADLDSMIVPVQGEGESALVLAMPFLRLGDLGSFTSEQAGTHFVEAHRKRYRQLLEATQQSTAYRSVAGQALIGMGHCFVSGATTNEDTERRVGNQDELPHDIFPPELSYVALGHLHKAQKIGGKEYIRYSGSALPLGFSEVSYKHQVVDVTIENGVFVSATPIFIPRSREFLVIPKLHAPWPEVQIALQSLPAIQENNPSDPLRPLLEIRIEPSDPSISGLREQILSLLSDKWPLLFRIDFSKNSMEGSLGALMDSRSLEDIQPEEVFRTLCAEKKIDPSLMEELLHDFHSLLTDSHEQGGAK